MLAVQEACFKQAQLKMAEETNPFASVQKAAMEAAKKDFESGLSTEAEARSVHEVLLLGRDAQETCKLQSVEAKKDLFK